MNKVIIIGRLTRDPSVNHATGSDGTTIARYSLAVDRRVKADNQPTADFIPCVAFGKAAEFAEKYLRQGMKIAVEGRIQTGSYTNRDGQRVYTTDVVIENTEFAESRNAAGNSGAASFGGGQSYGNDFSQPASGAGDFMNIPEGIEEELPFN